MAGRDKGAYALRGDGTVWAWGDNGAGQLGNGEGCGQVPACESRVPVRVAGLTDVSGVEGFAFGAYALRADGSVWGWGSDRTDELGNADVVDHAPSPVPVGGLAGVRAIGAGWQTGFALVPDP
ncbi:hypothetical protein [Actinophytocola oryzae]|uniref:Regulator of chromosome condensation (RCC1) repeat-containing protein n=1 Tax=Actinophytocola oryzae TaxID=502181 RepID=A0A4R7VF02_9PSEU|nr:hypothetical protein [Actinophytocola oryzae]TDV47796.1 regulator of chromosome condensation (RCC1) repeat-containing protein [Actinophytocola oryzae]